MVAEKNLNGSFSRYETESIKITPRIFRGPFWFYLKYSLIVVQAGLEFLFARKPWKTVAIQSYRVLRLLEKQGIHLIFEGLDKFPPENGPYVFVSNHMSTLEVNAFPGILNSRIPTTYIVKSNLLKVPFFGIVLQKIKAITVERRHPGEDLIQVLEQGKNRLSEGISILLFPEGTRQSSFSSARFNSLAVKLALKAGVPVVPVALKTDCWGIDKKIKDFGSLDTERPAYISFGDPLVPTGRGRKEHQKVVEFIETHLKEWGVPIVKQ